jgi:hypothetical protein
MERSGCGNVSLPIEVAAVGTGLCGSPTAKGRQTEQPMDYDHYKASGRPDGPASLSSEAATPPILPRPLPRPMPTQIIEFWTPRSLGIAFLRSFKQRMRQPAFSPASSDD